LSKPTTRLVRSISRILSKAVTIEIAWSIPLIALGTEGKRTLSSEVAVFQSPQLAAVRLNKEEETAAVGEFVGLRLWLRVLNVKVGKAHWGNRSGAFLDRPRFYPHLGAMQRAAMRRYAHINHHKPLISVAV
jgi:hypothetical protein